MAEADLSKIVNMIMENPELIEQIKRMSQRDEEKQDITVENTSKTEESLENPSEASATYVPPRESNTRSRRKDLLYALKSYVSEERGKAIDTMMSIADILDMMRQK